MSIGSGPAVFAAELRQSPNPTHSFMLGALLGVLAVIAFDSTRVKPAAPQAITKCDCRCSQSGAIGHSVGAVK